jgi:hypothetical protein
MVVYASWFNNQTKVKYNSYGVECLAIDWVMAMFQCYLFGSPYFTLVNNYQPWKWLMESHQLTRKLGSFQIVFL